LLISRMRENAFTIGLVTSLANPQSGKRSVMRTNGRSTSRGTTRAGRAAAAGAPLTA
jgi:hypothetical protein